MDSSRPAVAALFGTDAAGQPVTLPDDTIVHTLAIVAKRGSGKTHAGVVMAETMLATQQRICVIDPIGVWWGLQYDRDGAAPGFPVLIIGGDHGHIPLDPTQGAAIGQLIADTDLACIIDLSATSLRDMQTFVAACIETLYRVNRRPLHVFIDEADAIAPQVVAAGSRPMFDAVDRLIRRGRVRGIGATLITQRPAVLHKNVLSQIDALFALRLAAVQDRTAIAAWVAAQADMAEADAVLGSLPSLPIGEGWLWSPGWLGPLRRVRVRQRQTFDSSRTPQLGDRVRDLRPALSLDLDAIRAMLAQYTTTPSNAAAPDAVQRTAPVIVRAGLSDAQRGTVMQLQTQLSGLSAQLRELVSAIAAIETQVQTLLTDVPAVPVAAATPPAVLPVAPVPIAQRRRPAPAATADTRLAKAERAILTILAQHGPRTKTQIAIQTGYSASGGGFSNALSALRSRGWIDGRELLTIAAAGSTALGAWHPLPTGRALLDHWLASLGRAERAILQVVVDAYPAALTRADIATRAGYAATGGGFANALGRVRTLGLITRGEPIVANAALCETNRVE